MDDRSFASFGGICAMLTAIASFLFAVALVLASRDGGSLDLAASRLDEPLANWLLALTGLFTMAAVGAVYLRLKGGAPAWSLWAMLIGFAAGLMTALHGAYDALRFRPLFEVWQMGDPTHQATIRTLSYVPNPVDPRGIGSLLLMGVFALVIGAIIVRTRAMNRIAGQVAVLWAVVLFAAFAAGLLRTYVDLVQVRTGLGGVAFGIIGPVLWLLIGRDLLGEGAEE